MSQLKQEYDSLSDDGFRVLAVATKELSGKQICAKEDERDLVLKGYVAFLESSKETAGRALAALHGHGVSVKILTGDNVRISRKVCKRREPFGKSHAPGRRRGENVQSRIGQGGGQGGAVCTPLASA